MAGQQEPVEKIKLWVQPRKTLNYFVKECYCCMTEYLQTAKRERKTLTVAAVIIGSVLAILYLNGHIWKTFIWGLYWIGLGILSSVGFGSGLHTFLLYLGPHIAKVTIAAYECNSVAFPEPPYPDEILCPDDPSGGVNLWIIMGKVRWEGMLWGVGTALGELPPYFMALTVAKNDQNEELKSIHDIEDQRKENASNSWSARLGNWIERFIKKYGFWAILICASVPNPLFDLAGMICGFYMIPFWTFFGATVIGKAFIKMHLQQVFVIAVCNEALLNAFLNYSSVIPVLGGWLQQPLRELIAREKEKLRKRTVDGQNVLGWFFEKISHLMILYFVISIVNHIAQMHHKRINENSKRGSKDVKAS